VDWAARTVVQSRLVAGSDLGVLVCPAPNPPSLAGVVLPPISSRCVEAGAGLKRASRMTYPYTGEAARQVWGDVAKYGGNGLNKRKRVALQKHRVRQRKLEEKRRATRVASTIAPARPRTAEPERPAPIVPSPRPQAPRRPRTAPRPAASQEQPQGQSRSATQPRSAPRPAPRRASQAEEPQESSPRTEAEPSKE
jgi:hypothetical protein